MAVEVHSKLRKKNCCERYNTLEVELIILLCDFMGSESLSSWRLFALTPMGKGLFDLDDVVFEKFEKGEKTLGELIERRGWDFFREKEFDCLESFLSKSVNAPDYFVLSLGGGSLNSRSLSLINSTDQSVLIWLESSFEKCFERILKEGAGKRPLL